MKTGTDDNTGTTNFLEQGYTIWDRKFGDPRLLTHDRSQTPPKYDGKLAGHWTFPFSIPFPSHVDRTTLRAFYPRESDGPVRFLPELLREESPLTPFNLSSDSDGIQSSSSSVPAHQPDITPFDTRAAHVLNEKGRITVSNPDMPTEGPMPHAAPIPLSSRTAPNIPLIEPYVQNRSEGNNPLSPPSERADKRDRSPAPNQACTARGQRHRRGAISMQDPELPESTTSHLLPQSFLERGVMVNVQYKLILTITHGRFSTTSR